MGLMELSPYTLFESVLTQQIIKTHSHRTHYTDRAYHNGTVYSLQGPENIGTIDENFFLAF